MDEEDSDDFNPVNDDISEVGEIEEEEVVVGDETEVPIVEMRDWIRCDRCEQWFHCDCIKIDPNDPEQVVHFWCGCVRDVRN